MATLERIRSRAGVLVAIVIGLALLAFILGDLLDSRTSLFRGTNQDVAKIAGTSVTYQQFEQKINELTEIYKLTSGQTALTEEVTQSIREQVWEQIVNELVMGDEYKELGITVSTEELFELVQGANPHQIILQQFADPETGVFNKAMLLQYLKNMSQDPSGNSKAYWMFIEKEITNQQLNKKFTSLIQKGLSVPSFMAKNDLTENNKKANCNYIVERFNSISDSLIKITDADLKNYYKANGYKYEQSVGRNIEYVTFDVVPSEDDRITAETWINKIKPDFAGATEVEQFVNANSEVSYVDKNYKKGELPVLIDSFAFNSSVGAVYGPYLESGSYKLAKIYKEVSVPDSVKARHILIRPKGQTKEDVDKAKAVADSLKNLIEKGADFAVLALQYSDDKSNASKGGDLEWFQEGKMVKPFSDAAFSGAKNKIQVVETNYGYHILQVTDRGKEVNKVKVAFIERKITASTTTFQTIYGKATKFSGENRTFEKFNAAVTKENLFKRAATIGESDRNVQGLESSRELIRWAFNAEEKAVSEPLNLGANSYAVATLVQIKEKGIAPLKQVKAEVEMAVRKQKKAEKIAEKIKTAQNGVSQIQDLALKLSLPVEAADGVGFSSYTLGNSGFEPKIIAYASAMQQGKISEPVEGNNGVYVLVVNAINDASGNDNLASISRLNQMFQSRVGYEGAGALRKLANIEDRRYNFY